MKLIKQYVDRLLQYIDSGRFFRSPIKVFYILIGVSTFLPVFLPIVLLFIPQVHYFISSQGTWPTIVSYLGVLVLIVYFLVLGFFGFFYWRNRQRDLYATVRVGDKIKAIPVCAHIIRCLGEWNGVYLFVSTMGAYLILYVLALISGGGDFEGFLIILFGGLLAIPLLCLILFLISYSIILSAHAISERLLIKAIVANNVSDLGDIHRAAVMPEAEESLASGAQKQEEPTVSSVVTGSATESTSTTNEE
ncbi:hypothetical protein [uncultured Porphyromonas sp.]|uniref:hypothetical protein n=1 Tax=uncultured Porphyromonas sp. TaxID=159274 RepID=UPI00261832F4|nr:hypothetical protein [uncultured Porphyromonas sp.]